MATSVSGQTKEISPFLKSVINNQSVIQEKPTQQATTSPVALNNNLTTDVYQPQKATQNETKAFLGGAICAALMTYMIFLLKPDKGIKASTSMLPKPSQIGQLWEDITSSMKLKDMTLAPDLKGLLEKVVKNIQEPQSIMQRGGKPIKTILLYGPPGTGKTTFAKAIAQEFPNSRFATLDVTRLGSKYVGETEKNIQAAVNEICEEAQKNPQTKFFVFIDEIDSVMMVDDGNGKKHSNDVLNEFKRCFTERLGKYDNIITIGATNLSIDPEKGVAMGGKILDKPMLDRFQEKIYVGLPSKGQILDFIVANYKDKEMVCDELKNKTDEKLQKLCEFLSNKDYEVSFRTLQTLFNNVAATGDIKEKVTLKTMFDVIKAKQIELKIPDEKLAQLAQDLGINI
ncbi:MAG: AAA family ATPase [Cyanobacteria bacterium SIG27]|nr:AAA family ATPase [Cyanobacteria bacterium SIG27]